MHLNSHADTAEEAPASQERFWGYTGKQSVEVGRQSIISGSLRLTGIDTQWATSSGCAAPRGCSDDFYFRHL